MRWHQFPRRETILARNRFHEIWLSGLRGRVAENSGGNGNVLHAYRAYRDICIKRNGEKDRIERDHPLHSIFLLLIHSPFSVEREKEERTIFNFISAVKMALMSTPIPLLVLAQNLAHLFLPSPGEVRRAYRRVFLSLSLRSSGERVTEFE